MSKVRFTRRAREDLLEIWLHITRQNSGAVADKVYDRIELACKLLRHHPQLGAPRPEIADDARVLVIDRWLALYRLADDGVQVVRIVDGVRDLTRIDWTEKGAHFPEGRDT